MTSSHMFESASGESLPIEEVSVARPPCAAPRRPAGNPLAALAGALAAGALLALPGTPAHASAELAQASRCMACHQVDRKVVGPALRQVAQRYANRPDAAAHLARKIREGGSGAWGAVPMAANPHVSEADARRLAQWVLTLK